MGTRRIKVNGGNLRALCASRGGAAAAEFAIMLPLLMLVMFGTLQISLLMYSYNLMASAARDTARAMAVCTITDPGTATSFQLNHALTTLPPWVPQSQWILQPDFGGAGSADVGFTISVDPTLAAIISYLPFNFPLLTSHVVMHKEQLALGAGSC